MKHTTTHFIPTYRGFVVRQDPRTHRWIIELKDTLDTEGKAFDAIDELLDTLED